MSRAKLYYIPGICWHITHRCHNRDFLLKFSRDRKKWLYWLFEAKKRYDLNILNYVVTCNHIHLLVYDNGGKSTIAKSIQLTAGRTAREYNQRKYRRGAFWEDRYHATAIESGKHLKNCMVYIDLNMVRTGVVNHPRKWLFSGYNEINSNRKRFRLINSGKLLKLLQLDNVESLRKSYSEWIESALASKKMERDFRWTESVAVGEKNFVEIIKAKLGIKVNHREIIENKGAYILKEQASSYESIFEGQNKGFKP